VASAGSNNLEPDSLKAGGHPRNAGPWSAAGAVEGKVRCHKW